MCKCLKISRSTYYYEASSKKEETELEKEIETIFKANKCVYGSRKLKKELKKKNKIVSRRRICRIMKKLGLVSTYTVSKFKVHKDECNEASVKNELNRNFNNQPEYGAVVSDLTYVRVNYKWNYVCILIDLFNREIIGFSAGAHKTAELVYDAFAAVNTDLREIKMFHTDRGSEFKNCLIDDMLMTFNIKRSLSKKGCPYDNAVAEANFKIFKTEFVKGRNFKDLTELKQELADYVYWFNNFRIHSSLNYLSPIQFKEQTLLNPSD